MALSEYTPRVAPSHGLVETHTETRGKHRPIVWLSGEHDISTVPAVAATLARAISLGDRGVLIDLHGVQFMDASTVGVMIRAGRFLERRSGSLQICAPSPCARRVLALCGLADLVCSRPARTRRLAVIADR